MKTLAKVILFLVLGLVGLCIVFAVIGAILNRGATITPTLNPTQTINPTETIKPTNTLDPSITPATPTKTIVPTKTKVPTKTPVPTSIYAQLGSLSQFIAKYYSPSMTELQRQQFVDESIGKAVNWTGVVGMVDTNYNVQVNLYTQQYTYYSGWLLLSGIPHTVAEKLSVNQTIHFTGQLTQVEWMGDSTFGNLTMVVDNVQIIP